MELVTPVRAIAIGGGGGGGGGGDWRLGYGGDSWNTAVLLARSGLETSYLTALGRDPFSRAMRAAWAEEGIGTDLVLTDPERLPGLYAIKVDDAGGRSFHYWRDRSAARRPFDLDGVEEALERAAGADLLYLSGITLSLFGPAGRERLGVVAGAVRARGGRVAFDPNYRPRGWSGPVAAREAIEAFAPFVSVALPTFDDEAALWGDAAPQGTIERWRDRGVPEVAVKLGPQGCLAAGTGAPIRVVGTPVRALDTTGAGDAFNAGHLAARAGGLPIRAAAEFGDRTGRAAVGHRGAVMARGATPRLVPGSGGE